MRVPQSAQVALKLPDDGVTDLGVVLDDEDPFPAKRDRGWYHGFPGRAARGARQVDLDGRAHAQG